MAEMTLDQQKALARMRMRARAEQIKNQELETEIGQNTNLQKGQPKPRSPEEENFLRSGDPTGMSGQEKQINAPVPSTSVPAGQYPTPEQIEAIQPSGTEMMMGETVDPNTGQRHDPLALWVPDAIYGGAYNAGAELAKTGGAVTDYMTGTDTLPAIEDVLPQYQQDTTKGQVVGDIAQVGAGALGGTIGAAKALGSAPTLIKTIGGFIGGNLGGSITGDKDTQPLITGDESITGQSTGASIPPLAQINEDDDDETKFLKKTVNLAEDAAATGLGLVSVGKTVGFAYNQARDIFRDLFINFRNQDEIKKQFVEAIIERAAQVPAGATPQQTAEAYRDIANMANSNKKLIIPMGDEGPNVVIPKDSISAIEEGMAAQSQKMAPAVAEDLHGLRQSARSGNLPLLEDTLKQGRGKLEETTDLLLANRGGDNAVDQTRQAFQQQARNQVGPTKQAVTQAEGDLANAQEGLEGLVRKDETFGNALDEAQKKGVDLDMQQKKMDITDEAVSKAEAKRVADRKVQSEAHAAIPVEAKADAKSFNEAYKKAEKSLPDNIKTLIKGNKGKTYEYLVNKVQPELSRYIEQVKNGTPNPSVDLQSLYDLKKNISQTQLDYLGQSGNQAVADAAKAAKATDIDVGSRWNQGIGEKLSDESKRALRLKPDEYAPNTRAEVLSVIKDPNKREQAKRLGEILGDDKGLMGDIAIADTLENIQSKLALSKGGKLSDVEVDEIVKPLMNASASLDDVQKARITKFAESLKGKKWDVEQMTSQLDEAKAALKAKEDEVYNSHLGDFFKKQGKEYEAYPNGQAVMDKIFNDKQSGEKIKQLYESADEVSKKGMQAAWLKNARDKMLATQDSPILSKEMQEYGETIMGKDSEAFQAVKKLNENANKTANSLKGRQGDGLPTSANDEKAQRSFQTIITGIWGYLNPTSTRIRKLGAKLLSDYSSHTIAKNAADQILADPEEFARVGHEVARRKGGELDKNTIKSIYRVLSGGQVYQDNDDTEKVLKK